MDEPPKTMMEFISRLLRDSGVDTTIVFPFPPPPKKDSRDFISLLPDCILGTIVSLLPPKAGARTAVLSRRWRYIWESVPVHLDIGVRDSDLRWVSPRQISLLLSCRRGPIRCVRASIPSGQRKESYDTWVQALARAHIDDTLALMFPFPWVSTLVPLYRLAHSLRRLELHGCRLDDDIAADDEPALPCLHSLFLSTVQVSEAVLHRMLHACTALQDLTLFRIHGLRRLLLRSTTLATIYIRPQVPMDELSFKDAPNLENIVFLYMDLWHIRHITIPANNKLLRQVTLKVPLLHRETIASIHTKWVMPIVTVLTLHMRFGDGEELTKAAHMISLFPCLNSLQIWCLNFSFDNYDEADVARWQQPEAETITCLNRHLEKVQMDGYTGTKGEVEFLQDSLCPNVNSWRP